MMLNGKHVRACDWHEIESILTTEQMDVYCDSDFEVFTDGVGYTVAMRESEITDYSLTESDVADWFQELVDLEEVE